MRAAEDEIFVPLTFAQHFERLLDDHTKRGLRRWPPSIAVAAGGIASDAFFHTFYRISAVLFYATPF